RVRWGKKVPFCGCPRGEINIEGSFSREKSPPYFVGLGVRSVTRSSQALCFPTPTTAQPAHVRRPCLSPGTPTGYTDRRGAERWLGTSHRRHSTRAGNHGSAPFIAPAGVGTKKPPATARHQRPPGAGYRANPSHRMVRKSPISKCGFWRFF